MDVLETDLGTEKEPIRYAIEFVGVMELENQVGLVVRANPHRCPVVRKSFLTPPIGLSQHLIQSMALTIHRYRLSFICTI